jgi:putative glutamine amidotransferase
MTPLIGITTHRQKNDQGFPLFSLAEAYVQAIVQAGGTPVLVPLGLPEDQLETLFSRLDGILFSGGGDIDPDRFGAASHPEIDGVDADRDRVEFRLILDAIQAKKAFLGICRGIQVINVALGGTLYTHVPEQILDSVHPPYVKARPRNILAHEILLKPGSRLAEILGHTSLMVNSLHHQGIARLASGFMATAHATDGLIEGIEIKDHPFGLAVQWHPEWLTEHQPMRDLFKAFVEAAAE